MPPRFEFEFFYASTPRIFVSLFSELSGETAQTLALLDTGADRSLFDIRVAERLKLDLASGEPVPAIGVGGPLLGARSVPVLVTLLGEPDLTVEVPVVFADIEGLALGNLIGLDVLEHFDFGLSHAQRLGYLGRAIP